MAESAFGAVLRVLRERREFSLRDLGLLADVDHAYISKMERGEKGPPPDDTFARLVRHVKPNPHELAVLRFLQSNNELDADAAVWALSHPEVTPQLLAIASTSVHRGSARPSPELLFQRAKRAQDMMDGND